MIAFINDHRASYGVEPICRLLLITSSMHHAHRARRDDPSRLFNRTRRDANLRVEIARIHAKNFCVYGAPKAWRQLRREGLDVVRCTVERLMRAMGLQGVTYRRPVKGAGLVTHSDRGSQYLAIYHDDSAPGGGVGGLARSHWRSAWPDWRPPRVFVI